MDKIVLLFPGQGSQYIGMGKELCNKYPIAKEVFDEASKAIGFDILELCTKGSENELKKTENAQPALLTASVAAFKVYMQEVGVEPKYLAGNSLGEISALVCAGVIDFADAVKLVRQRGKFMQSAVPFGIGAMVAIAGISKEIIEEECRKISTNEYIVAISNYNSEDHIVVSGHDKVVREVGERLESMGAKVNKLNVSAPFHSPLMKSAGGEFAIELNKYEFNDFKYPVLSNVTALPYESKEDVKQLLINQISAPVQWQKSIQFLQSKEINVAIEIGPKHVLTNMLKKSTVGVNAYSFDSVKNVELVKIELCGREETLEEVKAKKVKLITRCLAIAVCTKNSNWDDEEYNNGVVVPYREVKEMVENLEKTKEEPSFHQMIKALDMLKSVFNTKKTAKEEKVERFNQIFYETGLEHLFLEFEVCD